MPKNAKAASTPKIRTSRRASKTALVAAVSVLALSLGVAVGSPAPNSDAEPNPAAAKRANTKLAAAVKGMHIKKTQLTVRKAGDSQKPNLQSNQQKLNLLSKQQKLNLQSNQQKLRAKGAIEGMHNKKVELTGRKAGGDPGIVSRQQKVQGLTPGLLDQQGGFGARGPAPAGTPATSSPGAAPAGRLY